MGSRITQTYISNPFEGPKQARSALIYCPTVYYANAIVSLSPPAIRILCLLPLYYNPNTATVDVSTEQIRKHTDGQKYNISRAITELAKANIIAKHKVLGKYYLNPDIFRPVTYEL